MRSQHDYINRTCNNSNNNNKNFLTSTQTSFGSLMQYSKFVGSTLKQVNYLEESVWPFSVNSRTSTMEAMHMHLNILITSCKHLFVLHFDFCLTLTYTYACTHGCKILVHSSLAISTKLADSLLVAADHIFVVFLLCQFDEVVRYSLVKILTSQVGVSACGQNLKNAIVNA